MSAYCRMLSFDRKMNNLIAFKKIKAVPHIFVRNWKNRRRILRVGAYLTTANVCVCWEEDI